VVAVGVLLLRLIGARIHVGNPFPRHTLPIFIGAGWPTMILGARGRQDIPILRELQAGVVESFL